MGLTWFVVYNYLLVRPLPIDKYVCFIVEEPGYVLLIPADLDRVTLAIGVNPLVLIAFVMRSLLFFRLI